MQLMQTLIGVVKQKIVANETTTTIAECYGKSRALEWDK